MPVTAKLSRKFYDTFGDEIVNELVEWFNQVDLTYRAALHDLNDGNFGRFDERLARYAGELRAEMDAGFARADARLEQLRAEMAAGFARADARLEQTRAELRAEIGALRTDVAGMRGELVKWMFLFWAGTALTVIGVVRF